jgi:ribosome-associated toxin RatA of RatAB toxin-antitoxin module
VRIRPLPAGALALLSALALPSAGAAQTEVRVSTGGDRFDVSAESLVAASPALAWQVLTGYEAYPDFVPGLSISRVVNLAPLRIEQRGRFGVLFFSRNIDVTLEIDERPRSRIFFRSVAGDLRLLETEVDVEAMDNGAVIRYRSRIVPDFWVPPLISAALVRTSVRRKLQAVAMEIERRADAGSPK